VKPSRPALAGLALAAALLLAVGAGLPAQAQCAMCQTALTNSPEGRTIAASFNRAILVMLFAPYIVLGTMATVLFRRPLFARLSRSPLLARVRAVLHWPPRR
jgi:hypothetical protein